MAQPQDKGDILVVDDQPANLKLMEDILKQEGYGFGPSHAVGWRSRPPRSSHQI
jgi:CheY-like chemotaxis protein